jgi:hypothetical protein
MSRFGRVMVTMGGAVAVVLFGVDPAHAGGTLQQCLDQAVNHNGEPPTCRRVNGSWVPLWAGDSGAGAGGIPGVFVFFFVVALLAAIGVTVWKVSTAQKLARQSGMDPGLATQMTLLTDDGLDATYLAASLRSRPVPPAAVTPDAESAPIQKYSGLSAADRLTELKSLLDQGLVTQTEYDDRRKAIIDTV